jgi:hypothetical protein
MMTSIIKYFKYLIVFIIVFKAIDFSLYLIEYFYILSIFIWLAIPSYLLIFKTKHFDSKFSPRQYKMIKNTAITIVSLVSFYIFGRYLYGPHFALTGHDHNEANPFFFELLPETTNIFVCVLYLLLYWGTVALCIVIPVTVWRIMGQGEPLINEHGK